MNKTEREFMLTLVPLLQLSIRKKSDGDMNLKYAEDFVRHYRIFIDASYYGEMNIAKDLDYDYDFALCVKDVADEYHINLPDSFHKMYFS